MLNHQTYAELAWLPPAPADFAARCRQLAETGVGVGVEAQRLANHALDDTQLCRLAKALARAKARPGALSPLVPFKLGIVSNATTHLLLPALTATAARFGLALECVEGDYGQAMQLALAPDSSINQAGCDAVLLAIDYHGLALRSVPGDVEAADAVVTAAFEQLDTMAAGLSQHGKTACLFQSLAPPVEALLGSYDAVDAGSLRRHCDELNRRLAQRVLGSGDALIDVAHLAETVGLANWHDPTWWNLAKLPFAGGLMPLYAEHVCRVLAAMRGRSRKCLVLDLDNTLWGGVVGDVGLDGIVVAEGDATGEAHLELQRLALALHERGVVLAVSSKNADETARRPFREHPEMLLQERHFAVFQANWQDKATNLRAIAHELSLGLEALVFVDDNPAERALVRRALPEVAVPELPADPAWYARTLAAAGYFEAIAFSEEDRRRNALYRDNARRVELQRQTTDLEGYLSSLEMRLVLQPFDDTGRQRIAQLINKSNQFNLTTRRYTEAEVASLQADPWVLTLQARLVDRFGDNGMISVLICRELNGDWEIDTWLMSCRVLGRKVEQAMLEELIQLARARGVGRLIGRYLPTAKNALVKDHYERLGFAPLERAADGSSSWVLDLAQAPPASALPMSVERSGFGDAAAA